MKDVPAGPVAEHPHPRRTVRLALYCLLLLPIAACGSMEKMDYSLRKDNFNREQRHSDNLAALNYDRGLGRDPYTVELNRARNHRGYALQTPLYKDDEGMKTHFTVSRTKEYRWFSGLQLSFNF